MRQRDWLGRRDDRRALRKQLQQTLARACGTLRIAQGLGQGTDGAGDDGGIQNELA